MANKKNAAQERTHKRRAGADPAYHKGHDDLFEAWAVAATASRRPSKTGLPTVQPNGC